MVVSSDLGDPASACHPIHPPWKAEVGRRMALAAANIIYSHTEYPTAGPRPVAVHVDAWQSSWGDYHLGYGSGVCASGSGFFCMGVRIDFDQPLFVQPSYGRDYGFPSGFELYSTKPGQFMSATLTEIVGPATVQLNATWVFGDSSSLPLTLRYAWHDYPVMFLANSLGQPVAPFNISLHRLDTREAV